MDADENNKEEKMEVDVKETDVPQQQPIIVDSILPQQQMISVDILLLIKEAQQHHGLRHKDYQRYRQYCARRLKRLRNSLQFKLGNRHGFKGKSITEDVVDNSRHLQMLLMNAERAWGYAMELKVYANTEPRKKFHMVRKLTKAVFYASELNKLCETIERVDARTKLEAQAYSYWMTANLKFEIQDWQSAVDLYTKARTIYDKLSTAFVDESTKVLYLQKVDEIGPNIRYCGYNLGQGGIDINELMKMRSSAAGQDMLAAKIDAAIQETRGKLASSFGEVTWRGKTVPIRTEKARICILRVQDKDTELARQVDFDDKMEVFDNLLMECKDVISILKDEIAAETASKKKSEAHLGNLQFIKTYISYLRQMLLVDRSLVMVDATKLKLPAMLVRDKQPVKGKIGKPEDLIRLFDSILQCCTEMCQLVGSDGEDTLKQEIEAQMTAYKAFRCFYIGQSYEQAKKWIESVALYERVISYTDKAIEDMKQFDNSQLNVLITKVEELAQEAGGHKYATHAASILETSDVEKDMSKLSINGAKVLAERLDEYYEFKTVPKKLNLVNFPPDMQPMPCKPLFFDLALNHIDLPDLSNRVEKRKDGGALGMVKGWLWGNKQ